MSCCGPKPKAEEPKFNADFKKKPLTLKFWSKHDHAYSKFENLPQIVHYENELEKRYKYDARCHSKTPRYSNQIYGWLPGYKLRFLQNCDDNLYKNAALQKVAKDFCRSALNK